jgi:hypothetical protein
VLAEAHVVAQDAAVVARVQVVHPRDARALVGEEAGPEVGGHGNGRGGRRGGGGGDGGGGGGGRRLGGGGKGGGGE